MLYAVGLLSSWLGLLISFWAGAPSGPLIILVAGGFYLVSLVLGRTGGLLRDRARSRHLEA